MDRNFVHLQMWGPERDHIIANHEFYAVEAKRRLLDQFTHISMEHAANSHAEEWLAKRAAYFDPDRDDPADAYGQAHDEGIGFYQSLVDLRNHTSLSIVAGMYHAWEKDLRSWMAKEFNHSVLRTIASKKLWRVPIEQLLDILELGGWDIRKSAYYPSLKTCGLVTNVFKHGNGTSFDRLASCAPDLVGKRNDLPAFLGSFVDYSLLSQTDEKIDEFARAITAFWEACPEAISIPLNDDLPKWMRDATKG